MKRLVLLLLLLPALLLAQENTRYLAGAVPMKEGKVLFTKDIQVPAYDKGQIYDIMLRWAHENFSKEGRRVVFEDREKGQIAMVSKEYIVFSSTALSLDRSYILYRLTVECEAHSCHLEMGGIRYLYDVAYQREPESYLAEEWITDEYALNGKKTKLNRIAGKFRKGTIDLADALFTGAANALGQQLLNTAQATPAPAATVQPAAAPAQTTQVQTTQTPQEGFVSFTADKVPETLLQMLPNDRLTLTAAAKTAGEKQAVWKGIGKLFGKQVAYVDLDPASDAYKAIGTEGSYRLTFTKAGSEEPWCIIECRKQGETNEGSQRRLIGEILQIWIK